jgi:AcrR family transcriptional regulator
VGAPRGDSAATRKVILAAARDLFARRGVDGVSVRQIAAAAGVNHALVHRYFGTKRDMVAEILAAEGAEMSGMAAPSADTATSLAAAGDIYRYALTEGRTSLLLMLRAEIDGLAPERMLDGSSLRPLGMLASWLAEAEPRSASELHAGAPEVHRALPDPRVAAMVLGAAVMGLASTLPMLAAGAGLGDEDPEDVLRRCVDLLVAFTASAAGAGSDLDREAAGPAD